ncbi:hypothetical protein IEQ34_007768 [Dendrobium chrysotoxum]|uniref:Uncharacterized protein n=1 Tax=Dendrobium chrysotoxum TaxID=161865 RepID=A0AAV7H246_DENCH|nr:hypothetical protein IEQ34_007768 [Dendrobium chrysotoxum]
MMDDEASTITGDSLIVLHKKFHILNDVVTMVLKRSDRAGLPPLGCGVSLSQFLYKAMSVTVNTFHGWADSLGRVGFNSKWLDMHTWNPMNSWANAFFFVKKDWGLLEKWGKMRDLPALLHVREEDIMRILKVPDVEHLLYEFKVGLSFNAGRSAARMLKPTSKVPKPPALAPKLSQRMELEVKLTEALNKWNDKFVKVKYLQGEYKQKYDHKTREVDLEEAQATITQLRRDQKASVEKVAVLEAENKRSQTLIAEKVSALTGFESLRVIKDFKKSTAFKTIIQDRIQEARDHIYEIEVKALEQQCIDEGFIRGFLKGVRLTQWKTGVEIEGLTPSEALDDSPQNSDGDEIESELQKVFALEVDDEIIDIE